MTRNELCGCGSGKRFKHCHGVLAAPSGPSAAHLEALAAHQSWSLLRAETLYRRAIEADPRDVDSLHMLGVVYFERRRYHEAIELLWDAAERTGWNDTTLRQNLGLVLAKLLTPRANARQEALVAAYAAWRRALRASPAVAARVTVVLPVHNEARNVGRAIASVSAQTYANLDLVVVDDGSTDDTPAVVAASLRDLPFPAQLVRSNRRGAAQAANHGAQTATGDVVAFLHGGDRFVPERIARMVAEIARPTPQWGFSQCAFDGNGNGADKHGGPGILDARQFLAHEPASFTLLGRDVIGTSGNLFVDRSLFLRLGGFGDGPSDTGWDFCLRAARQVEPIPVAGPLYLRRRNGRDDAQDAPATPADPRRPTELVIEALASGVALPNEFCPSHPGNRDLLLRSELRAGHGDRLPVPMLRALADEWRVRPMAPPASIPAAAATPNLRRKTALVVLGMYRSGTSAIARALNLGGAFLPERVIAAKLGLNPKGFWEAEAVTDIDARLLELLGGDWDRVDFEVPTAGPVVEQFLVTSREVLATDYENAPLIVIKDPRICVLAPLWHRALGAAEYRQAYVVLVRDPLEVAASIESQGDMSLADGLALWLTYMRRVEIFAESGAIQAVHVRYTDLLDDWRGVLRRVARRLGVSLDLDARADEIDRFLEAGMRNHRATDVDMPAGVRNEAGIRALHARLLKRCDQDALRRP